MPDLIQRLSALRKRHLIGRIWGIVLIHIFVLAAGIALMALATGMSGVRETTALATLTVSSAAVLLSLLWRLIAFWRRRPGTIDLAIRLEKHYPEMLDSLATAVERHARPGASRTGRFDEALFRRAMDLLDNLPPEPVLLPWWRRSAFLAPATLLLCLVFPLLAQTEFLRKCGHAFHDMWTGESSGLVVLPDPLYVARGADLTIEIGILRWEQQAKIHFKSNGEWRRDPIPRTRDGRLRFNFYGVTEPIPFRILTPSLTSAWKTVTPFTPPRIDEIEIRVIPPVYTGIEPYEHTGFQDVRVPEGSSVTYVLVTRGTGQAHWVSGEEAHTFNAQDGIPQTDADQVKWEYSFTATGSKRWKVVLTHPKADVATTEYRLDVIPDEPPMVEILKPARDMRQDPDENLYLEIHASDDYGLSAMAINLSIAGRFREQLPLRPRGADGDLHPRETRMPAAIDFRTLEVEDGELVTYWISVSDNREPEPQHARSEIYFVEVRVEQEPEEADGMPDDEERINLRASIEELKRIIRLSHRTIATVSGEDRLARNQETVSALNRLRHELQAIHEEIKPMLEAAGDRFFTRGFESVDALLRTAARLVTEDMTESSLSSQEQALQELIAMENALQREMISREPADGESDGDGIAESGEGDDEQDPIGLDAMEEMLRELDRLSNDQRTVNRDVERAAGAGADIGVLEDLADRQRALERRGRELERTARRSRDMNPISPILGDSVRDMYAAADYLDADQARRGWRDGLRALDSLEAASSLLEELMASASRNALERLLAQVESMAGRQRDAATSSRGAADGEEVSEDGHATQREINRDWDQLLERARQLSEAMGESRPDMSRALNQAIRDALRGDPSESMTRATNALLYERFRQAAELQEQSAVGMDRFGEGVASAAASMPELTAGQLQRMLESLDRDRRELTQFDGQLSEDEIRRMDDIRGDWSQRLEGLQQQTGEDRFSALSGALGHESGRPADRLRDTIDLFDHAAEWIESIRDRLLRREFFQSRRRSAPPPEPYRQQVEDYFRRLAEEEEN